MMNWHIEVIAAKLEACQRGEIRRLIINLPPRHLKSLCASVAFPAWVLGLNPAAQILCVSYAQDLADKLARDCRGIITSAWYKAAFPTRLASDKQAIGEFVTRQQGCRLATSVSGVLTGRGADIIIIDDPLKPEEALSEAQRKRANDWYDNTLYSRQNDKTTSCIILIMQRLHEDDLVGHLLEQEAWEVVSFPAIAEQAEEHRIITPFGPRRFTRRVDDFLHPQREPRETLARIRQTLGEYNFAGQYHQAPAPAGGGLIKAEWFKFYEENDRPDKFDQIVQSWDTANKVTELSDYSVCSTWGIRDKHIYLLHVLRRRMEFPELKRAVVEQARLHRASVVLIEDKASGTQLIQELIKEGLICVQACKAEHDKIMRLHAQTPAIENGLVSLPKEAPRLAAYLHELTTFPNAKYDDQADSTSQALAWVAQVPPEPGIIGFYRREAALMHHRDGLALAAIAGIVKASLAEVEGWINERAAPHNELIDHYHQAMDQLRGEKNCAKCGQELPAQGSRTEAGGRYFCSLTCAQY